MKTIIRLAAAAVLALALCCAAALAAEATAIAPDGAREVEIVDADGARVSRAYDLPIAAFYLVDADSVDLRVSAGGADPAVAAFYSNHDSTATALADLPRDGERYLASTGVDSLATTGYESTMVAVMPEGVASGAFSGCTLLFRSEDDLDFFCANRVPGGASWRFAGEDAPAEEPAEADAAEEAPAQVSADYRISFVGEAGEPVAGVVANVCDDVSCTVVSSDDGGLAAFSLPPYAYDVHVVQAPEGYAAPAEGFVLPAGGGDLTIVLPHS